MKYTICAVKSIVGFAKAGTGYIFTGMKHYILLAFALLLFGCPNPNNPQPPSVITNNISAINYSVVAYLPHDTSSFTEGLLVHNGQLYESTGHPPEDDYPQTRSLFGITDVKTGRIDVKAELDKTKYFGEGITMLNNKIYQLTLSNKVGYIYDAKTFKKIGEFTFANKEGWGMTTDGTYLIMSDGTGSLTYLDTATLKSAKTLAVTNNGIAADSLNELEYIKGFIYANEWLTSNIVKIDPATGNIVGIIDLSSLTAEVKNKYPDALELNGIAYDAAVDKIYVTGKLWPTIYQITFPH